MQAVHHFDQMAKALRELEDFSVELLEHHYAPSSFGSWSSVLRHRGIVVRATFDGKDGELVVERSTSSQPPYEWQGAATEVASNATQALHALRGALARVANAG